MGDADMVAPEQLKDIVKPHAHDVLSGRGNFVNHHSGNENFRKLVKHHKVAYVACPKAQKAIYSKIIYDEIRATDPPGRFLKQDPKTKLWSDIGEKKALDKTRQALREGAPELLKELETGGGNAMDVDDANSMSSGGKTNVIVNGVPQDMATPLHRMQHPGHPNLRDSLLGNMSLGSFSLGSQVTQAAGNGASFNAGNPGTPPVPTQVGVGDVSLLAVAAQLQAAQQQQQQQQQPQAAAQQQAMQQKQAELQLQQVQALQQVAAAAQQQKQAEAQLQLLRAQMQMNSQQQANNLAAAGAMNGLMGNAGAANSAMGGNAMAAAAAQAQAGNMGMGSGDMTALLAAIHNRAAGMNGATSPAQQAAMGAYQQQLAQMAMINQLQNSMNESNSTLRNGSFNAGQMNSLANLNNPSPFQQAAGQQPVPAQEKSLNISIPLKPSSGETIERAVSGGGSSSTSDGASTAGRRIGGKREASGSLTSSFTRAQRIGLKNSFTSGRRPNRHLNNPELAMMQQLALKNSLMSIESLTLDDIDSGDFGGGNMEGVFEDDVSKGASRGGGGNASGGSKAPSRPCPKTVHGHGAHDVSEVSELEFEDKEDNKEDKS